MQSEKILRYLYSLEEYKNDEVPHIQKVKGILFEKNNNNVNKTQFANKIRYLINFIESYAIHILLFLQKNKARFKSEPHSCIYLFTYLLKIRISIMVLIIF
mgnify:CR=1 FL=1